MIAAVILSLGLEAVPESRPLRVKNNFPKVSPDAVKVLKISRGKAFNSGAVFVDGKFIPPPYVVERYGTYLRINRIQVTSQVIAWDEFLKTQSGVEKITVDPGTLTAKEEPLIADGIFYTHNKWVSYEKILSETISSNCILEILQNNQHGATLRYFEAVCYNKKLLTNNKDIIYYPFYNPKWMKVFTNISEIDIEWLRTNENIDYKYNGEFSPKILIDKILKKQ
jgi:hypothetical protein